MRIPTLTRTVTIARDTKSGAVFGTLWPTLLSLVRQTRQQDLATEIPASVRYTDDKTPPQADAYVMLVESDIRKGVRGILP
jgi:hypothetical protein